MEEPVTKQPSSMDNQTVEDFKDQPVTLQPESKKKETQQIATNDYPEGLKELDYLDELLIQQHLVGGDVCCQRPCRYSVYRSENDEENLLFAEEVSECYARQCLGAIRGFSMNFTNRDMQDVIRLDRPLRCPCGICWWWCCCVQELRIESPPGRQIGVISEDRICCPRYYISDESEMIVYRVEFNCCLCKLCNDVVIPIYEGRKDELVAEISKRSKGNTKDCCGSENTFTLKFYKQLHIQEKILLLGASFLIDFNMFERQQRSCC